MKNKKVVIGIAVVAVLAIGGIGAKFILANNVEDEVQQPPQMGDKAFNKEDMQKRMDQNGGNPPEMGDKGFNKEDIEAKAEEAGMSVEEYMKSMQPDGEKMKMPQNGDKEFNKEDMENKMEEMKTKAEEAGMTLEEYRKSIQQDMPNKEQ